MIRSVCCLLEIYFGNAVAGNDGKTERNIENDLRIAAWCLSLFELFFIWKSMFKMQ